MIRYSFTQSLRGDFQYLKADFIIDCKIGERLLDPTDPKYLIEVDHSKLCKNRAANLTLFMQKQRALKRPRDANLDSATTPAGTSSSYSVSASSFWFLWEHL